MSYSYDDLGERTKATPEIGAATSYEYDQAGSLISVDRPEKESVSKIEDTYAYNGDGLRASQRISGTTSYFAWDTTEELPLILDDGTNSYIYGPSGYPVEQINSEGTVTYLHHDEQGSIRLLTGGAGTITGSITFGAYGDVTGKTGTATTPLGYDGQYTEADTGLIYLRAREYDPGTGGFLSVDPEVETTLAPYNYAGDDPINAYDPSGLGILTPEYIEGISWRQTPLRHEHGHEVYGWTLVVHPTLVCRAICWQPGSLGDAWNQVQAAVTAHAERTGGDKLGGPPSQLSKSIYDQFKCHTEIGVTKGTWDLDTWRPAESMVNELLSACNPGSNVEEAIGKQI